MASIIFIIVVGVSMMLMASRDGARTQLATTCKQFGGQVITINGDDKCVKHVEMFE